MQMTAAQVCVLVETRRCPVRNIAAPPEVFVGEMIVEKEFVFPRVTY